MILPSAASKPNLLLPENAACTPIPTSTLSFAPHLQVPIHTWTGCALWTVSSLILLSPWVTLSIHIWLSIHISIKPDFSLESPGDPGSEFFLEVPIQLVWGMAPKLLVSKSSKWIWIWTQRIRFYQSDWRVSVPPLSWIDLEISYAPRVLHLKNNFLLCWVKRPRKKWALLSAWIKVSKYLFPHSRPLWRRPISGLEQKANKMDSLDISSYQRVKVCLSKVPEVLSRAKAEVHH